MPSLVTATHAADGTELLVRHWPTDGVAAGGAWAGRPWASVMLVHGLGEQSGRYEHVGDQFADAGLETWAFDRRGNGGSGGRRGHVDDWTLLHDDIERELVQVRAASGGRTVVLYGHSLGGLLALGYLLTDRPKPAWRSSQRPPWTRRARLEEGHRARPGSPRAQPRHPQRDRWHDAVARPGVAEKAGPTRERQLEHRAVRGRGDPGAGPGPRDYAKLVACRRS